MESRFLMQVVDKLTGEVVSFEPGLSAEIDFVEACISRAVAKRVGFFRSTKKVEAAIKAGIAEAIHELKLKVKP